MPRVWPALSMQSKVPCGADDEEALTDDIVALAKQYGRYGYRWVTALLQAAGWSVSHKRVERIWRREGLKVPQRQPKRGRLWLNDGSCIRLRPGYPGHIWVYDFVRRELSNKGGPVLGGCSSVFDAAGQLMSTCHSARAAERRSL